MPNLELSKDELVALHEALETYVRLETEEAADQKKDLTTEKTFMLNKGLYERVHRTIRLVPAHTSR